MVNLPPTIQFEETLDGAKYALPRRDVPHRAKGMVWFGAVFGGFALFWMTMAIVLTFAADDLFFRFCFPLFGIPFLLIGTAMFAYGMNMTRGQATIELSADELTVTDGWGIFRCRKSRGKHSIAEIVVRSNDSAQAAAGCMLSAKIADGGRFRFAKGYSQGLLVLVAEDLLSRLGIAPTSNPVPADGASGDERISRVKVLLSPTGIPPVPSPRPHDVMLPNSGGQMGGIVLLIFAIIWNGIVAAIGTVFFLNEGWDFWPLLILGVFAFFGLFLLFGAIHKLLAQSRMHPPAISLSVSPVLVGEKVTARFVQAPKRGVKINRVTVRVICRESATYTHGTNTSTVTHEISKQEHVLLENQHASPLQALEGEFEIVVPDDAMHSFSANHNSIQWTIESHTDIAGWPDYKHSVSFDVAAQRVQHPGQTAEKRS